MIRHLLLWFGFWVPDNCLPPLRSLWQRRLCGSRLASVSQSIDRGQMAWLAECRRRVRTVLPRRVRSPMPPQYSYPELPRRGSMADGRAPNNVAASDAIYKRGGGAHYARRVRAQHRNEQL
jgi:hypothetical protein